MKLKRMWEVYIRRLLSRLGEVRDQHERVEGEIDRLVEVFDAYAPTQSLGKETQLSALAAIYAVDNLKSQIKRSRELEGSLLRAITCLTGLDYSKALPEALEIEDIREKLQRLNMHALESLPASEDHGEGGAA